MTTTTEAKPASEAESLAMFGVPVHEFPTSDLTQFQKFNVVARYLDLCFREANEGFAAVAAIENPTAADHHCGWYWRKRLDGLCNDAGDLDDFAADRPETWLDAEARQELLDGYAEDACAFFTTPDADLIARLTHKPTPAPTEAREDVITRARALMAGALPKAAQATDSVQADFLVPFSLEP